MSPAIRWWWTLFLQKLNKSDLWFAYINSGDWPHRQADRHSLHVTFSTYIFEIVYYIVFCCVFFFFSFLSFARSVCVFVWRLFNNIFFYFLTHLLLFVGAARTRVLSRKPSIPNKKKKNKKIKYNRTAHRIITIITTINTQPVSLFIHCLRQNSWFCPVNHRRPNTSYNNSVYQFEKKKKIQPKIRHITAYIIRTYAPSNYYIIIYTYIIS